MSILLVNSNAERIPLADGVVHAVVTSPPYYGLRKYAVDEDDPEIGLEETPELYLERMVAVFREVRRVLRDDGVCWVNMGDSYAGSWGAHKEHHVPANSITRDDGRYPVFQDGWQPAAQPQKFGMKPLDLMNIPARLVLALQADGWYHRSTIIWSKPNPMPESVSGWRWERHRVKVAPRKARTETAKYAHSSYGWSPMNLDEDWAPPTTADWRDCPGCEKCAPYGGLVLRRGSWRPTTAHEYIFMLTKTAGYWADGEAVREGYARIWGENNMGVNNGWVTGVKTGQVLGRKENPNCGLANSMPSAGRNARTVWDFPTQPWSGAHFATYPEELPRRCLKASISERGCCPKCGSQWARVIQKDSITSHDGQTDTAYQEGMAANRLALLRQAARENGGEYAYQAQTLGWLPTCECGCDDSAPPIVLDPFCGSGTTGLVARELGAHFVGLDLSYAYLHDQARARLGLTALDAWSKGKAIKGTDAEEYQHKNMTVPGRQPHSFHIARVKDKNGKVITDLPLFQAMETIKEWIDNDIYKLEYVEGLIDEMEDE